MDKNKIIIFDTTLRDGEQSPGASMNTEEKIQIALQLERLGVDVMEAGFAAASPGDFDAINQIAKQVESIKVASLSRALERDIKAAADAIAPAKNRRIHTFIATSPIHMEHKLKMKPDEVIKRAVEAVQYAKSFVDDVEFSCEDAGRSDISFLKEICDAVVNAGAVFDFDLGEVIKEESKEEKIKIVENKPVEENDIVLSQIKITRKPAKTNYTVGEKFDKTGMEITAIYSDGTSKVIDNYTFKSNIIQTTAVEEASVENQGDLTGVREFSE